MKTYKSKLVECGICNEESQLWLGPVDLFNNEIWFSDHDDTESMVVINRHDVTCYQCLEDEFGGMI